MELREGRRGERLLRALTALALVGSWAGVGTAEADMIDGGAQRSAVEETVGEIHGDAERAGEPPAAAEDPQADPFESVGDTSGHHDDAFSPMEGEPADGPRQQPPDEAPPEDDDVGSGASGAGAAAHGDGAPPEEPEQESGRESDEEPSSDDPATGEEPTATEAPREHQAAPQLQITKSVNPDPLLVGGEATYTITVTNNGDETAEDVTVTDTPDADVTLGELPAECSDGGSTISCGGTGTSLAAGESLTYEIPVTVGPGLSDGTNITNRAAVTSSTEGAQPANTQLITVAQTLTDVEIIKTATDSAEPGGPLTYTITVINHGPSNAVDVTVQDATDGNLTTIVNRPSECAPDSGLTLTCPLGVLGPSEQREFTFESTVNGDVAPGTAIENCATSTPERGRPPRTTTVRARRRRWSLTPRLRRAPARARARHRRPRYRPPRVRARRPRPARAPRHRRARARRRRPAPPPRDRSSRRSPSRPGLLSRASRAAAAIPSPDRDRAPAEVDRTVQVPGSPSPAASLWPSASAVS